MVTCKYEDMETKCIAVKVSKALWKSISVAAMEGDKTLAEVVVPVLEKEFSEERLDMKRRADGLRKKVDEVFAKPTKPVSAPTEPIPEEYPKEGLKEGYGWCLACKVKQVKLPNILCERCK